MKISKINVEYASNHFHMNIEELDFLDNKINIVIGENGCGKSVLLKEILKQQDAIMLMQDPYIFNKKVIKALEFIKKISGSDEDIDQILKLVNLENEKDMEGLSLSGGQKQRLAFAMVLLSGKDVILLDEPFNGIDVYSQKLMVDIITRMRDKTFIIVTHRLNHAKSFGDYFVYIRQGRVLWKGDKQTFFTNKDVNEFVLYE